MLGEAFLHVLNYTEETPEDVGLSKPNTLSRAISRPVPPSEAVATHSSSRSAQTPRPLRASRPEGPEKPAPCLTSLPSTAVPIPSSSLEDHWGLKAMHCTSIYKAYPDLQLAGDTVGPLNPTSQSHSPLLNSEDLTSLEASMECGELVEDHSETGEAYLVMDSVRSLGKEERLTNSMLNSFLENQLMEVYRQHMQDSLARCGLTSLSASVVPGICSHLSVPDRNTSTQKNELHSSQSQSSIRYLSTCSAPPTSHFSTPVLRISYQPEPES